MMKAIAITLGCLSIALCIDLIAADQHTEFAIKLYKEIGKDNKDKNLFISPVSVSTAFGMVHLGSAANTKTQLKTVLGLDNLGDPAINDGFKSLIATLKSPDNNYTLYLVNRLFGSSNFAFEDKFKQESENYFQASLQSVDFKNNPDQSRVTINNWVADQTNQKIKELLTPDNIKSTTTLVLVNAIYFKANWRFPFVVNDTASKNFRISKSENVPIDTMSLRGKYFSYLNSSELNCEVLELPYAGEKASMFILLPRDVDGLPDLESKLTAATLTNAVNGVQSQKVNVQFPKFSLDQSTPLKQFLQTLGMTDLFDSKKADLTGITKTGRLYADEAAHKTFINVDEYGTEAAAATAVLTGLGSTPGQPVQFIVDRPFLFLIYEKTQNNVLFIGRLLNPSVRIESIGNFGQEAAALYGSGPGSGSAVSFASHWVTIWSSLVMIVCLIFQ